MIYKMQYALSNNINNHEAAEIIWDAAEWISGDHGPVNYLDRLRLYEVALTTDQDPIYPCIDLLLL